MDVYIGEFDIYIEENIVKPKLTLEREFGMIHIAITATTIGVLLIGFLINFGKLRERWKLLYIISIFSTLSLSLFYTTIPLF